MSPSGIHLNKAVVLVIVGLFIGVVAVYKLMQSHAPSAKSSEVKPVADSRSSEVKPMADDNTVVSILMGDKSLPIYTQSSKPSGAAKLDVLFLHGASFTSKNWVNINTLKLTSDAGYNAVAVDLPGFGQSKGVTVDDKGGFLKALIAGLKLSRPVIVSPSMSGGFALPFLFSDPATITSRSQGWVAIAPVGTAEYKDKYPQSQIPTLIMLGSRDAKLGAESKANLQALPKATVLEIADAGHACYLDQPDKFHKGLLDFLSSLQK